MLIFDSHAHYLDTAFDTDRDAVLTAQFAGEVCGIIENGIDVASSRRALELAHRYPAMFAAVGIHPEEAAKTAAGDLDRIRALSADEKAVAIGEIGLDYHWEELCPRAEQQRWLHAQLELAVSLDLPVILHDRDAHADMLEAVRRYRPRGTVHCFSGSAELAEEYIRLGMYIGLGGVVTFKNARKAVEVAAAVPEDRLLLETDAPYLAPVPCRGERCDSSLIRHTATVIAAIRGITPEVLCRRCAQNTVTLYRLPPTVLPADI